MADAPQIPDEAAVRAQWGDFAFTSANMARAKELISHYPEGRQASAVLGLLDLAQRQVGEQTNTQGWLPVPVIEYVAQQLDMPYMRVYEVVTFFGMFNMVPVGRFHVQVCGTTPCMLRGADDLLETCYKRGMKKRATTADGLFTLSEIECIGNCASGAVVQINDDNYEDLTAERLDYILDELAAGRQPKTGTQEPGRHTVEPVGEPTNLAAMMTENHDYRGEW